MCNAVVMAGSSLDLMVAESDCVSSTVRIRCKMGNSHRLCIEMSEAAARPAKVLDATDRSHDQRAE